MEKLSQCLKVVDNNEDFIYFKVLGSHTDFDRDRVLVMNGFDGRETFIRVMIDDGKIIAVTLWFTARTPENTLTFRFTPVYACPDPVIKYMKDRLDEVLKELKLI